MQKIQVTTVPVNAPAQVVLPNTYFTVKLVKAQFAIQRLKKDIEEQKKFLAENHRDDLRCIEFPIEVMDEIVETSESFLNELVEALEGKEE